MLYNMVTDNFSELSINEKISAIDNIYTSGEYNMMKKIDFFLGLLSMEKHPQLVFRIQKMIERLQSRKQSSETVIRIGDSEKRNACAETSECQGVTGQNEISRPARILEIQQCTELSAEMIEEYLEKEKDVFVQATMIKAIGRFGGKRYVGKIFAYLNHPDPRIRANAVEALMLAGEESAMSRIAPLAYSGDNRIAANSIRYMDHFGQLNDLLAVEKMISHGDENHLRSAIWVLKNMERNHDTGRLLEKAQARLNSVNNCIDLYSHGFRQQAPLWKKINPLLGNYLILFMVIVLLSASIITPVLLNANSFNRRLLIIKQCGTVAESDGIDALISVLATGGETTITTDEVFKEFSAAGTPAQKKVKNTNILCNPLIEVLNRNGWEYHSKLDNNSYIFLK